MQYTYHVLALSTCFNRREKTENSIKKLIYGNPTISFDFIIVDDNSSDGTAVMLEQFDNVEVVCSRGYLFYSGGMREAIRVAKLRDKQYDYCLFFNDDVDFFDCAIERLITLKKEEIDILVGATCDANKNLTYAGVRKDSKWIPRCKIVFAPEEKELMSCDTFNANCVLIDYDIFMKLDNIDPVYIHGMGDYDYGFEASRKGCQLAVANFYCGVCEKTTEQGSWRDRSLTRYQRLKMKNTAKGTPNSVWFHYLYKNYNLITAIVYSISPYVRIILGK